MTCGGSSLASGVPSTESTTTSSLCSWSASGIAARCTASHAIRVNDQYRIAFRWEGHDAFDVRCEDYH